MSWRFAYSPKWIIRHVAVVLLVSSMLLAMFWQLSRLHDKKAFKTLAEHRELQAPAPIDELLPRGVSFGSSRVGDVLYRTATASGTYIANRTFTVENRTDASDQPGAWVLTPLDIGGGRAVVVNRGFLGYDVKGRIVAPPPPSGGGAGHRPALPVPGAGLLQDTPDPEVGSAQESWPGSTSDGSTPRSPSRSSPTTSRSRRAARPRRRPPPRPSRPGPSVPREVGEGPPFSYAIQWGIFSTIALRRLPACSSRKVAIQEAKDLGAAGTVAQRWRGARRPDISV